MNEVLELSQMLAEVFELRIAFLELDFKLLQLQEQLNKAYAELENKKMRTKTIAERELARDKQTLSAKENTWWISKLVENNIPMLRNEGKDLTPGCKQAIEMGATLVPVKRALTPQEIIWQKIRDGSDIQVIGFLPPIIELVDAKTGDDKSEQRRIKNV